MSSVQFATQPDIFQRVAAIKKSWSPGERKVRHLQAQSRQLELASLLGFTLETPRKSIKLQRAS